MKAIHAFLVLFLMGFVVNCATIYGVQYEYDEQAGFESFKTYYWMAEPGKTGIDSLIVEGVRKAVNDELQAKGLMMTSNNPDFLIAEHLEKKMKFRASNWVYGYGPYGIPHGIHQAEFSGPTTDQYEEGSLILDFVDAKSKEMIWRGVGKAEVNTADTPEKKEKLINEAVHEILKNFPPKPEEEFSN